MLVKIVLLSKRALFVYFIIVTIIYRQATLDKSYDQAFVEYSRTWWIQ